MKEHDIPTPALVIDLATVHRNIEKMASYGSAHGLKIRPHTKTHKSIRMAKLQMEAGAVGLTVAKVGEAGVLAEVCDDLFLAYPVLDRPRVEALAQLGRSRTMRVEVDSALGVDRIAEAASAAGVTIGVMVDLDTGVGRTGLQTPQQTLELAQYVDVKEGLRLDGLFTYQGHVRGTPAQMEIQMKQVAVLIQQTLDLWREHGLDAAMVSGGSTPSGYVSHHVPQLTEIRPGTYIYRDWGHAYNNWCDVEDCAGRIVTTVVSNAVPGKVVLDGGSKTLAMDGLPGGSNGGHGLVVEYPQAVIDNLTEEHGRVDITHCDAEPRLGDRVHVIPNHICVCVNLQNHVWFKDENGDVEMVPVDTRGLLS